MLQKSNRKGKSFNYMDLRGLSIYRLEKSLIERSFKLKKEKEKKLMEFFFFFFFYGIGDHVAFLNDVTLKISLLNPILNNVADMAC
jgi:hypothetical protein